MESVWICCSSGRPAGLVSKTLRTLTRGGFKGTLTVCVPFEELPAYRDALDADKENRVRIHLMGAKKGLVNQRRAARALFAEGCRLVFIDDDVSGIKTLSADGTLSHCSDVEALATLCFERMPDGTRLWGVYPVANRGWMKRSVSVGNCYIVGAFYGILNCADLNEPGIDEGEDYARQLCEQEAGHPPVRYNYIGIQTAYYANAGGLQQTRTESGRATIIKLLADSYGEIVRTILKGGKPDLRFLQRPRTHYL